MIEEKRVYPRKHVSFLTHILENKTERILGDCLLTDISKNGFAVESEKHFSIGKQICLNIEILHKKIILSGKVVRMGEGLFYSHYGLQIIDNECKNLDFFRQYIDYSLH